MPGYYADIVGEDGHVTQRISMICHDDADAKHRAKALVDGHAVEVWQEKRKVAMLKPENK